jgi:hypothetical protein
MKRRQLHSRAFKVAVSERLVKHRQEINNILGDDGLEYLTSLIAIDIKTAEKQRLRWESSVANRPRILKREAGYL